MLLDWVKRAHCCCCCRSCLVSAWSAGAFAVQCTDPLTRSELTLTPVLWRCMLPSYLRLHIPVHSCPPILHSTRAWLNVLLPLLCSTGGCITAHSLLHGLPVEKGQVTHAPPFLHRCSSFVGTVVRTPYPRHTYACAWSLMRVRYPPCISHACAMQHGGWHCQMSPSRPGACRGTPQVCGSVV